MKRLLCIVGGMNTGGSETFLMKMYRKMDRSKYQFDFAEYTKEKCFYDDEILSLGGKIYRLTPKKDGVFKNFREIYSLVKKYSYKYVLRSGQNAASCLELFSAKLAGAQTLIMKSTNSKTMDGSLKERIAHRFFRPLISKTATVKIGPSEATLDFMFGKNALKHGAKLFHNAVDTNVFRYSPEERLRIRNEFGISDQEILLGHIGRFTKQKNHDFLLDLFNLYLKTGSRKAKLFLIGTGELETHLKEKATSLGINKEVIFAGTRSDIPSCLSAMDIYVFPSLYEGLPNTVIEAQAIGIPCVISDTITKEAILSCNVKQESLLDMKDWILDIDKLAKHFNKNATKDIGKAGYDLNETIKDLENLFFN